MSNNYYIMRRIILSLIVLLPMSAVAQEAHYYVEHPHSVTFSTGIPNPFALALSPGNPDSSMTMQGRSVGLSYKTDFITNYNVGYNYQVDKRWEVAFIFTVCGTFYTEHQYPKIGESAEGAANYDWKATPTATPRHYVHWFIPAAMVRFYWLARNPAFQMYSGAGAGYALGSSGSFPVLPTLTPVAIRFGAKHWYGQFELTLGTTASLILGGVGYRF